jgi:predicted nucleotidyltransferase
MSVARVTVACHHGDVTDSPRLTWVRKNAARLLTLSEGHAARRLCLCGSVARGEDYDDSDIDFYAWEFSEGDDARERADSFVESVRAMCPYRVDVRAHDMPGWPLEPPFEESMQRDAIHLSSLAVD